MTWRKVLPSRSATAFVAAVSAATFTTAQASEVRFYQTSDSIEMTDFPSLHFDEPARLLLSPSGRRGVVLTQRGELTTNTNVYELWLLSTLEPKPTLIPLARYASSSNRPAISSIRWIDENRLAFLGEEPDRLPQVRVLAADTRVQSTLTNFEEIIENFDITKDLGTIALEVRLHRDTRRLDKAGYVHGDELLHLLLHPSERKSPFVTRGLRVMREGTSTSIGLDGVEQRLGGPWRGLRISPTGRYVAALMHPALGERDKWRAGTPRQPGGSGAESKQSLGAARPAHQDIALHIFDSKSGRRVRSITLKTLSDDFLRGSSLRWCSEDEIVLLSAAGPDRKLSVFHHRVGSGQSALSRLPEHEADPDLDQIDCRREGGGFVLRMRSAASSVEREAARKNGRWDDRLVETGRRGYSVREDLNEPPELVSSHGETRDFSTTFNASLRSVRTGRVEEVSWQDGSGRSWTGKLLLPLTPKPPEGYPLVLYTHGKTSESFWADGSHHAAMGHSARALASKGIAVLEMDTSRVGRSTPDEVKNNVDGYAAAIVWLLEKGLIDKRRIGIHAWSRTGYYLLDALLDRRMSFAAASAADADVLSRQHLTDFFMIPGPGGMADVESLMGAPFWGDGVQTWIKREPMLRLAELRTPLRIETTAWLPAWWDVYALLRRAGMPAEYVSYPDGDHSLVKPLERLTSQQGSVDWFAFWLLNALPTDEDTADRWLWLKRCGEARRANPGSDSCG